MTKGLSTLTAVLLLSIPFVSATANCVSGNCEDGQGTDVSDDGT